MGNRPNTRCPVSLGQLTPLWKAEKYRYILLPSIQNWSIIIQFCLDVTETYEKMFKAILNYWSSCLTNLVLSQTFQKWFKNLPSIFHFKVSIKMCSKYSDQGESQSLMFIGNKPHSIFFVAVVKYYKKHIVHVI